MSLEEKSFNINQNGQWPNERYQITPIESSISFNGGPYSYNDFFRHSKVLNKSFISSDINDFMGYDFEDYELDYSGFSPKLSFTENESFFWTLSSFRKYFDNKSMKCFFLKNGEMSDENSLSKGFIIYPTRLFLKPNTPTFNGSDWEFTINSILLSANVDNFHSYFPILCAIEINKKHFSNYLDKIEIPVPNSSTLHYTTCAIQRFVNRPIINYTATNNPNSFNFILEPVHTKIQKFTTNVSYNIDFWSTIGTLRLEQTPFYNLDFYGIISTALCTVDLVNSDKTTFKLLQSAVNNQIFSNDSNSVLSANFFNNTARIRYEKYFSIDANSIVSPVSGNAGTFFGVSYTAECPYFRNTLEVVDSTIFSYSPNGPINENIDFNLKYPPHHYSFSVEFSDSEYPTPAEKSTITFDLTSRIHSETTNSVVLSTYLFTDYNILNLPLEIVGSLDLLQIKLLNIDTIQRSKLSCYYSQSEIPYDVFSSPWIPANLGGIIKIEHTDPSFGETFVNITTRLSTFAGFIDSSYQTPYTFFEGIPPNSYLNSFKVEQTIIDEGSGFIISTVNNLTSENINPFRDLSNSLISWNISPNIPSVSIISMFDGSSITKNEPVLFNNITNTVRVIGYGNNTISLQLSSQKYDEFSTVQTSSALFEQYSNNTRFLVGPIKNLNNLNYTRTISLTALLDNESFITPINPTDFILWDWTYNNSTVENFRIVVRKAYDGSTYTMGELLPAYQLSSINVFIEPTIGITSDENIIEFFVKSFIKTPLVVGSYKIVVDNFPTLGIFDTQFFASYATIPTIPILNTKNSKVLTRKLDNNSNFIFRPTDPNIIQNFRSGDVLWNIKDNNEYNLVDNSSILSHQISAARITYITLSAINTVAPGWVSAHNISQTLRINTLPPLEFDTPLIFNLIPELFWNDDKVIIANQSNFTQILSPTAYQNTVTNSNNFLLSTNKIFDKYVTNINTPILSNSAINVLSVPDTTQTRSNDGLVVSLTGYNEIFPETNGISYLEASGSILVTSQYNIFSETIPSTQPVTFNQRLRKNPKTIPYGIPILTFTTNSSNYNLNIDRIIRVNQNIQVNNPFNGPVKVVGGSVTYTLSSRNWKISKSIPYQNGEYELFGLNIGNPTTPLFIESNKIADLVVIADGIVDTIIPDTTFDNYPSYTGNKSLWRTISQSISSINISMVTAFKANEMSAVHVSNNYSIVGYPIYLEFDSPLDETGNLIETYVIDYGDNSDFDVISNGSISNHIYQKDGTFNISYSATYTDSSISTSIVNTSIKIYQSWVNYDQDNFRILDNNNLVLPFDLNQCSIQPNEFGNVDIFNNSIERLYKNYEFLIDSATTLNGESPTYYYGWFGETTNFDSISWHTENYKTSYYQSPSNVSNIFTNITNFYQTPDHIYILDAGTIKIFKNRIEYEKVIISNYSEVFQSLQNISSIYVSTEDGLEYVYVSDIFSNKIYKYKFDFSGVPSVSLMFDIGGFGSKKDPLKFFAPTKILKTTDFVYVLDYRNNCIKKYTENLTWVRTYQSNVFEISNILDFSIHPSTDFVYVLSGDGNIYIFDDLTVEYFNTIELNYSVAPKNIYFDFSGEFLYCKLENESIVKLTMTGIHITTMNLPLMGSKIFSIYFGDNKDLYIVYNKCIIKVYDILEYFTLYNTYNLKYWPLTNILLSSNDFADDVSYNTVLLKLSQNIQNFRNSLKGKFVINSEQSLNGLVRYFSIGYVKSENLPILNIDVENQNLILGVNEFHISQIINREISKVFESIEILKNFLNINADVDTFMNNTSATFCWSGKSVSCYNLKLPMIKILNVNPITFEELENSFPIAYAPTKTWGDATSECCADFENPS